MGVFVCVFGAFVSKTTVFVVKRPPWERSRRTRGYREDVRVLKTL